MYRIRVTVSVLLLLLVPAAAIALWAGPLVKAAQASTMQDAGATISPSGGDYGNVEVGETKSITFTVKNTTSDGDWYIVGRHLEGTDNAADVKSFKANDSKCGMDMDDDYQAGDSCQFTIDFTPTSTGDKEATYDLITYGDVEADLEVFLSGTGTSASTAADLASLQSGAVPTIAGLLAIVALGFVGFVLYRHS